MGLKNFSPSFNMFTEFQECSRGETREPNKVLPLWSTLSGWITQVDKIPRNKRNL